MAINPAQVMGDPELRNYMAQLKQNHHVMSRIPGTSPSRLADLCSSILLAMGEMNRRHLLTLDEATDQAGKWYKLQRTYEQQEEELDTQKNVGVQVGGEKLAPQGSVFKFAEEEAQRMMEREALALKVIDALTAGLTKDLKNTDVLDMDIKMAPHPGEVLVTLNVNDTHHPSVSVFATVQSVLQANKAYTKVRVTVDILTQITSHFTVGG